jgi:uncharacterized low-complexity protein
MSPRKHLITLAVAAGALSLVLTAGAQAALVGAKAPVAADSVIVQAAKKAKTGPGRCGAHMYWDAKGKKCVDSRTKK